MPLLKGSANIGHNIREMEEHGHPKKQAVAAALRTAYDTSGEGEPPETGNFNSQKKAAAQKLGAIVSHDDYARPTTAMTVADINEANTKYWGGENGNVGPAASEASAPELAGTRVVPVYRGAGMGDEVSPTQSDPPDRRSDNLLGAPAVAGEHDSTPEQRTERKAANPNKVAQQRGPLTRSVIAQGTKMTGPWHGKTGRESLQKEAKETNHWENESLDATEDDLAMNTESMPPEGQADGIDSSPMGRIESKHANKGKISQKVNTETRGRIAKAMKIGSNKSVYGPKIGRKLEHMAAKHETPDE